MKEVLQLVRLKTKKFDCKVLQLTNERNQIYANHKNNQYERIKIHTGTGAFSGL